MRLSFFFSVCLVLAGHYGHCQSPAITFSDLNVGLDTRFTTNQDSVHKPSYRNRAAGISGRFQTSVVANYVNKGKNKKFVIGDMIAGELATGLFSSEDHGKKQPVWFAFRFDLGLGTLYSLHPQHQIGLNWVMMRFSNDFISEYISGSELQLRYRYKRVVLEIGTIGRYIRGTGFLETYYMKNVDRNMTSLGFRYLVGNDRNVGVRLEYFKARALTVRDELLNIRVYYGLYF